MARNIDAKNHVLKNGCERETSPYGPRTSPINGFHNGVDLISSKYGTDEIIAIQDGVVEEIRTGIKIGDTVKSGGNYVYIKHESGYRSQSHHLKEGSIRVKKGDVVKKGQVIGFMGETGLTYGAHLHLEIWKDGSRCDPVPFLLGDRSIPAAPAPTPAPSAGLKVGDKVTYSGRLYSDSSGNGAGKTVSGTYTVSVLLPNKSHGVLLNDGLGWVREVDCRKAGGATPTQSMPTPAKPKTFTQGCKFKAGKTVYGTAVNAAGKIKPLSLSPNYQGKQMTADAVYAGGAVARYGNIGFFRIEDVTF